MYAAPDLVKEPCYLSGFCVRTDLLRRMLLRAKDLVPTSAALLGQSSVRCTQRLCHADGLRGSSLQGCSREPEGQLWKPLHTSHRP